jgi:hypothetical protein
MNSLITNRTANLPGDYQRQAAGTPRHTPGAMNKTEQAYSVQLDALKAAGEITWWAFEAIKLKLADKTYYTPDFVVMLADGALEIHETKGFWQDDSRVKWKCAQEKFWMFKFRAFSCKRGTFTELA